MNGHDQRDLWIAAYGRAPQPANRSSAFVDQCLPILPPGSRILELGCGGGEDAHVFAHARHTVVATDFVPAVIEANRQRLGHHPILTFAMMQIDKPYPYPDGGFDAIYAHLTLHYFPPDITIAIFDQIHRVLKPGGLLLFASKSPDDPAHGKGVEIEPDMFEFHGKIRHFFSEDYAQGLLAEHFPNVEITSHRGKLYRQRAGWITVIARSTPDATPLRL